MRRAATWLVLIAATVAAGWGLGALGLPSPYLFAALLVGVAVALTRPAAAAVPDGVFTAAQAVTGVTLGAYLQSSSLSALGGQWLPVTLVSAGTLLVSLGAGALLARTTKIDPPTAALGLVAGGASGIVGMARELGADDRLVAFMQYLRVLVVVLLTPLLVAVAFPGHGAHRWHAAPDPLLGDVKGWLITLAIAPLGALLAGRLRVPAASLMGPMIVSGVVTLAVPGGAFAVPALLREAAFIAIGLQVGLRFTAETVRQVGRLLVPVIATLIGLLAACFGLGVILAATTSVSLLDAYLATTPGGLYAVLAVAVGAGANTTFIVAVQGLRLLVMVLLAPAAVRLMVGRGRGSERYRLVPVADALVVGERDRDQRAGNGLQRLQDVGVVPAGDAEAVDDQPEHDGAGDRGEEDADDPTVEAIGQEDREVPDGQAHHHPGEHGH